MNNYIKYLNDIYDELNKVQQFKTTTQTSNQETIQINDNVQQSLELIKMIYESLPANFDVNHSFINKIDNLQKRLELLFNVPRSEESDLHVMNTQNTNWNVLYDIFQIFIESKDKFDDLYKSSKTHEEVLNKINSQVTLRHEQLKKFHEVISSMNISIRKNLNDITGFMHEKYNAEDVAYAQKTTYFTKLINFSKLRLKLLTVNYGNYLSEQTYQFIENEYAGNNLEELKKQYVNELKTEYANLKNIRNDMNKMNGGGLQTNLYTFNLLLQKTQITLHDLIITLKESEQINMRFINYVMYRLYSAITNNQEEHEVYEFMKKEHVKKYLILVQKIANDFNTYQSISNENKKKYVNYLNKTHYFIVKRLYNFLQFVYSILDDEVIIDVNKCKNEVLSDFILFNEFKLFLDEYEKY